MSSEKSFVAKVEQNVDDLGKVRTRKPWLFYLLVAGLVIIGALYVFDKLWGIPRLQAQIATQQERIGDLTRDRDAKATQLAPFLAVANKQFQDTTESERLKKLLQQIEEATIQMRQVSKSLPKPRRIDEAASTRFLEAMKNATNYEASISFEGNQRESAQLANQLQDLFTKAGWKVEPPSSQMTFAHGELPTFEISVKSMPAIPVQTGIRELLNALHLPRQVNQNTNLPENQLRIYVGPQ
jgi:Tfp pilus assembly protein PilN